MKAEKMFCILGAIGVLGTTFHLVTILMLTEFEVWDVVRTGITIALFMLIFISHFLALKNEKFKKWLQQAGVSGVINALFGFSFGWLLFESISMGLIFATVFGGGSEVACAKERKDEQEKVVSDG